MSKCIEKTFQKRERLALNKCEMTKYDAFNLIVLFLEAQMTQCIYQPSNPLPCLPKPMNIANSSNIYIEVSTVLLN